jgi:hypothetical protein
MDADRGGLMMARTCDCCGKLIEQAGDEYLELSARVLVTTENENQDAKDQTYYDCCDACIVSGDALKKLLASVNWDDAIEESQ